MRATLPLLALLWALPPVASAQPMDAAEGNDRWIPAVGLNVGLLTQDGSAQSSTSMVFPPAFDMNPQQIRPSTDGDGALLGATFGGSLEVMTPGLDIAGSPRLFARVGAAGVMGSQKNISREGSPAAFAAPPDSPFFTEDDILGQGSATKAAVEPLLVRVAAGVSFSVPLVSRVLRIKPSFEYIREEIKVTGVVHRAIGQRSPLFSLNDARLIVFNAEETQDFHGIGPGIELETDAARAGDFVWSVFLSGQAYYFLGDLEVQLSDSAGQESAAWSYEKEEWGYHVGVGVRFRWLPE